MERRGKESSERARKTDGVWGRTRQLETMGLITREEGAAERENSAICIEFSWDLAKCKSPDAEKEWRQKKKGATGHEMVREHHRLNGHESEQTLRDSGGQRRRVCHSPWGRKESDTTYWLNNNNISPQAQNEISWAYIRIIFRGKKNYQESHKGLENVCFLQLEWSDLTEYKSSKGP